MYFYGDGVARDPAKAVAMFTSAADKGHPDAQFNLGVIYFTGDADCYEERCEGGRIISKGCGSGKDRSPIAEDLAFMYQAGEGVAKDLVQAYVVGRYCSLSREFRCCQTPVHCSPEPHIPTDDGSRTSIARVAAQIVLTTLWGKSSFLPERGLPVIQGVLCLGFAGRRSRAFSFFC